MGNLRPNYTSQGMTDVSGNVKIPILNRQYERVWVVEQIQVFYNKAGDAPTATVTVNGQPYSGPAQMMPKTTGVGQTFGGYPYLYLETNDTVTVDIIGGTSGVLVNIQVQYREIDYNHDELEGRF